MSRFRFNLTLLTLIGALLTACGTAEPTVRETPDAVAVRFVQALAAWDELTLREITVPGDVTEFRLQNGRGVWDRWNTRFGPQTDVQVMTQEGNDTRAILVLRSIYATGESEVQLTLIRDGATWKVEAWDSYLP